MTRRPHLLRDSSILREPGVQRLLGLLSGDGEEARIIGGAVRNALLGLPHGDIEALGLRIGGFAYAPDLNSIPSASEAMFENLDTLLIDALRYRPHPSHFSLDETLAAIERFKPRRAVLTNMHTDLDYETLRMSLPKNVAPAFDGMQLTIDRG